MPSFTFISKNNYKKVNHVIATSILAHLSIVRGMQKRGPLTLQTRN